MVLQKIEMDLENSYEEAENNALKITQLDPKIQRFIHLYMTGQYTINKLAQLLEVHPNTVSNWLRRSDIREVINDMQQATHDIVTIQLKALTLKATNRLNQLVDSPIDGVAFQAVKDILDRAGHKAKQEIKIDKTVRTFEEKLQDLTPIIDAEFEVLINDEEEDD